MLTRSRYFSAGEPDPVVDPANQGQQDPDYAGYPDLANLKAGYRASGEEAKRQKDRADRAEQLLQQAMAYGQSTNSQAMTPERQLSDLGIPVDALEAFIDRKADEKINRAFSPIAQAYQGRNKMLTSYPEYNKFEADITRFVEGDAETSRKYQSMFNARDAQGNPIPDAAEAALEYAYLKFGEHQRQTHPQRGSGTVNRAERAQAQIPGSRTGDTRQEGDPNWRARARERYEKDGNSQAFAKAILGKALSDEFLNGQR